MVGLPESLDVSAQGGIDVIQFGGDGLLAFEQQPVNLLQGPQHGQALRLGWVRGEDRLQVNSGGLSADGVFVNALGEQLLNDGGYRAGCDVGIRRADPSPSDPVSLFGGVGQEEVGEKGVAHLGREPERPALDELHDLRGELRFGFLPHAAPTLSQPAQLLDCVEDLVAVNHADRVAQQAAEQSYVGGQRSVYQAAVVIGVFGGFDRRSGVWRSS